MELIHVATLIHDDVVDNADTRRGVNATAVDFGNRVSVLAGDYLFAWIFKNVTANYPHPIPHILSRDARRHLRRRGAAAARARRTSICRSTRTSRSRARRPPRCSPLRPSAARSWAAASAREIAALRAFGDAYGIAFQMQDDLLDMTADERSLGKPVGNDLTERKMTIPLILALAAGDRNFAPRSHVSTTAERTSAIPAIVAGIARQGGLGQRATQIAAYVERAKAALEPIAPGPAKEELGETSRRLLAE